MGLVPSVLGESQSRNGSMRCCGKLQRWPQSVAGRMWRGRANLASCNMPNDQVIGYAGLLGLRR